MCAMVESSSCAPVTTVDNFDLVGYASKPWYVQQQAINIYTPRDLNRCVKAEYNIRDRKSFLGYTIDVSNSAERPDGYRSLGGDLCADYDINTPSQLKVAPCWLAKAFAGPYWVVSYKEDDINGYALVSGGQPKKLVEGDMTCGNTGLEQCCRTGEGINNSGLWILTRQPIPSQGLVEEVRKIAQQNGFSTNVLFNVDHTNCDYGISNVDRYLRRKNDK